MKRVSLLLLAILLTLSISACQNKDVVICKVGNTEILRSEYESVFNAYYQNAQYQYDMTNADNLKALQDIVFDTLVRAEVIYQQALAQGYALTADEEQQLIKDAQAQYDSVFSYYQSQAKDEGAEDVDAKAKELFKAALKDKGFTEKSLLENIQRDMRKTAVAKQLEAAVKSEITFTEQDAQARFTQDVAADRKTYTDTPAAFADAQGAFESNGGVPPLYVPEGYMRVKHILVADEATANQLVERINAGEDFDKLMAEFGTDPGMQSEPNKSLGYLMNKDTNFVPEFKEAALKLMNVGDITAPVKTDYGYHIIKLVSKLTSGERSFSDVKDAYVEGMLAKLQTEHFRDKVTEWMNAASITKYEDRIRDLGQAQQ